MSSPAPGFGETVQGGAAAGRPGGLGLRGLALAVLVAALAAGSAAVGLAALGAFQRTLTATVDSRLSEVATEVVRHVENGLQAGVALEQQRRLLAVMADERSQAPDLSSIRVLDERGRILFSTNEAEIGESAAQEAAAPVALTAGRPDAWRRADGATLTVGLPLVGLFGEALGSVTVSLPADSVAAQRERFALALALGGAAVTLSGGLLAALLLALLPLPATRRLQGLRRRLDRLYEEAGRPRPALPQEAPAATAVALAAPLARFESRLAPRLARLAEREAEVRRLDETA